MNYTESRYCCNSYAAERTWQNTCFKYIHIHGKKKREKRKKQRSCFQWMREFLSAHGCRLARKCEMCMRARMYVTGFVWVAAVRWTTLPLLPILTTFFFNFPYSALFFFVSCFQRSVSVPSLRVSSTFFHFFIFFCADCTRRLHVNEARFFFPALPEWEL